MLITSLFLTMIGTALLWSSDTGIEATIGFVIAIIGLTWANYLWHKIEDRIHNLEVVGINVYNQVQKLDKEDNNT